MTDIHTTPVEIPTPYPHDLPTSAELAWVCEYIVDAEKDLYCVTVVPFAIGVLFEMASDVDPYVLYVNNSQFSCQLKMRVSSVLDINTPPFVLVPASTALEVATYRRAALSAVGKLASMNFVADTKKKK